MTYSPGRLEADWLLESLEDWFDDGTLTDVLYKVRAGKEATVYCCRGGPSVEERLVAAKVYRPRRFRELTNDAIYREGRGLLDRHGHAIDQRDTRMARAQRRGTRHGKRAAEVSWVMHEFVALDTLFGAGAPVPEPFAVSNRAVLTSFVGDEEGAAPSMDRLHLDRPEAERLLEVVLGAIETMLSFGWAHGDLSPYNLLLWEGQVTVIDLPQVIDVLGNARGTELFLRDVERVCDGFARWGAEVDPIERADLIWDRVFRSGGVPDTTVPLVAVR
ncbi:MAG: RIO1 family regulatory kinase/ATPase [Myxococcota bacterium]